MRNDIAKGQLTKQCGCLGAQNISFEGTQERSLGGEKTRPSWKNRKLRVLYCLQRRKVKELEDLEKKNNVSPVQRENGTMWHRQRKTLHRRCEEQCKKCWKNSHDQCVMGQKCIGFSTSSPSNILGVVNQNEANLGGTDLVSGFGRWGETRKQHHGS